MRVAFVMYPVAPYRLEWIHFLTLKLGEDSKTAVFHGQDAPKDHAWKSVFKSDAAFDAVHCATRPLPAPVVTFLRKTKLIRGDFILPSFKAVAEVAKFHPDLVVVDEFNSFTLPVLVWARLQGVPVIFETEMGAEMPDIAFSRLSKWKHTLCSKFVVGQFSHTKAALKLFSRSIKHVLLTPHAVDSQVYLPIEKVNSVPVILFVGNLIPRKGIDLLLQAVVAMREMTTSPFKIRLVGGGDIDWAKEMTVSLGLSEVVEFFPFKEGLELVNEYQHADVFVLPSRFDTFGVVTHEAACCGLPLIISRRAGSSELLVEDGRNGFVVDPEDKAGFAARMVSLVESKELRMAMGGRSRVIAEQWCVRKCGERSAEMLENMAAENRG